VTTVLPHARENQKFLQLTLMMMALTHGKRSQQSPITALVFLQQQSNKGGLLALASSTTGLVSHKAQKWSKS
jgi:hypothetical protein